MYTLYIPDNPSLFKYSTTTLSKLSRLFIHPIAIWLDSCEMVSYCLALPSPKFSDGTIILSIYTPETNKF